MFKFPYTNLHELNLDWILEKVKTFAELIPPMQTAVEDVHGLQTDVEQAVEDANQALEDAQSALETAEEAKEIAEQAAQGTIADGAVTTAKLANDAVTGVKIADGTITGAKLADGTVYGAKIAPATIQTGNLSEGCVTSTQILDGTILTEDIADNAITNAKMADNAVNTAELVNGAVTTQKLADNVVTNVKLSEAVRNKGRYFHEQGYQVTMPEGTDTTITSMTLTPGSWFIVGRVVQNDSQTIFVNAYLIHCTYTLNGKSNTNNGSTAFAFGVVEVPANTTKTIELQSYPYDASHRNVTGDILAIQLSQPD